MNKKTVIVGSILGVLLLGGAAAIAGPIIYRDLIVGPADAAPADDLGTLEPSSLTLDELAGNWSVTDGSYAGYRVDEVLNGTDVTVTGRTETVSGTVEARADSVTSASIDVDVASIATDQPNRDDYFRNNAMKVDANPTATFVLTSPIAAPTGGLSSAQTVAASGDLTLAGVTRPVTADITVGLDGDTVKLAGSIPITFADFGVTAPNLGFVSVEPTGDVEFLVVLAK